MPAQKFTHKANTPKKRRMWNHVRDSALSRGASRASAIMQANAVVKRASKTKKKRVSS